MPEALPSWAPTPSPMQRRHDVRREFGKEARVCVNIAWPETKDLIYRRNCQDIKPQKKKRKNWKSNKTFVFIVMSQLKPFSKLPGLNTANILVSFVFHCNQQWSSVESWGWFGAAVVFSRVSLLSAVAIESSHSFVATVIKDFQMRTCSASLRLKKRSLRTFMFVGTYAIRFIFCVTIFFMNPFTVNTG